jgi:hypothetical protein
MPVEITFIAALPGWDVLYYSKATATRGPEWSSTPVIAWGIYEEDSFVRAQPVTADCAWSYDDARTICGPNGEVICGDLEHWDNIGHWFDEMKRREVTAPSTLPEPAPEEQGMTNPHNILALDKFRDRFRAPAPPITTHTAVMDDGGMGEDDEIA